MIKKLGVSLILECHCICSLIYFWRMSHDPGQMYWHQFGWSVYFNCIMILPTMLLSVLFSFTSDCECSLFDIHFLTIEIIFSSSLFVAFILQYLNILQHTYGYQICIAGIISATFLIIFNSVKHGYYRTN